MPRRNGAIAIARLELFLGAYLRAWGKEPILRFVKTLDIRGWALVGAAALCLAVPVAVTTSGNSAYAGVTLEERKLPMKFNWVACRLRHAEHCCRRS